MHLSAKVQLVLGALLLTGGAALFSLTPRQGSALAAGETITSDWTASQYINVTGHGQDSPWVLGPVTIGVTKWHVTTQKDGVLVYDEDWSADVPNGAITFSRSGDTPTVSNNFNKANWLYSVGALNVTSDHPYTITFTNTPSGERATSRAGRQNFSAIGNSMFCSPDSGNASCLGATGSYGFAAYDNMGDGFNDFPAGFGSMIPTHWTVTGHLH